MARDERSSRGWNAAAYLGAGAAAIGAVTMLAGVVLRAGDEVYAMTPATLLVCATALALTLVGAGVAAVSKDRDLVLLGAIATLLALAAVALSIFGVVLVPLIVLTSVALGRRASGRSGVLVPIGAGPAIAVGLAVLLVVSVQPPLVRCHEHGASTSSRPWWGSSTGDSTSGQSLAPAGPSRTRGTLETPTGTYTYQCDGSELTEFRKG